jgi:hypothetical protein
MALPVVSFFRLVFALTISALAIQVSAASVSFAGDTTTAAAAVAMNGSSTHISDLRQAVPIFVSADGKYPPIDYKPQVFQREFSKLQGQNLRVGKNKEVLKKIAAMYVAAQEFNRKNGRELKVDVLTVEAIGGAKGFARSKRYATQIYEALKAGGVQNLQLDPPTKDPIPLPPELTGEQPKGRT